MNFRVLVLSLLMISCATGDGWEEEGFVATPAGDKSWWVSYEGKMMSQERTRDHLLYHTARLVLDNGGTYFRFDEAKGTSRFAESSNPGQNQPVPDDPAGQPYEPGSYSRTDRTMIAEVEIVDGPGPSVFDASTVIAELNQKYERTAAASN